DLGDQRVDERLVDLLALALRRDELGDEGLDAALRDLVALVARGHLRLGEDLVEERAPLEGRRTTASLRFRSHGSTLSFRLEAELVDELVALGRVPEDLLDLVAERLLVAERTLEGRQRRAQIEELLQLGDLVRDGLGLHVGEAAELEVHGDLRVL